MNKTMMKLVIGTEGMFFICLILSFVYMAFTSGFEPHELTALNIEKTGIFTIALIASSITFWLAEKNYKDRHIGNLKIWLTITIALGAVFLIGQDEEYIRLISEKITIGSSVFGTSFYMLTGFHGLHVFIGLVLLGIILSLAFLGDYDRGFSSVISVAGIYWHFVDIVWIVVFLVIYVMPHFTNL